MIRPTVGSQVWYRPRAGERLHLHDQPFAATVLHVWSDTCVNLLALTERGEQLFKSSCILAQDRAAQPGECEWMPYQLAQPAREQALAALVPIGSQESFKQPSALSGASLLNAATGVAPSMLAAFSLVDVRGFLDRLRASNASDPFITVGDDSTSGVVVDLAMVDAELTLRGDCYGMPRYHRQATTLQPRTKSA